MRYRTLLAALLLCGVLSVNIRADAKPKPRPVFTEESARIPADPAGPGTSTTDLDLVDVDADGDLDLFVTNGTDSQDGRPNRLLINDGHGNFADESSQRLPARVDNSTHTAFGDLDGDGDIDALVANLGPEQLLLNDGTGHFTEHPERLPAPPPIMEDISPDVQLVDIDGDGDLDALIANENPFDQDPLHGGQNRLLLNDGAAQFSDASDRLPVLTDQTSAIATGDIDGDGDADVVVLNRGQDLVLINDGTGHFTDETSARLGDNADTSRNGALADLDGDGDLDLFVVNSRNEPIAVYRNQRDGHFKPIAQNVEPFDGETDTSLALVDLDDDGDLDIYLTNAGASNMGHGFTGGPDRILRNNGNAKFKDVTDQYFTPPNDPSTAVVFGDIDADCDLDLLVGNSGDDGAERVFIRR